MIKIFTKDYRIFLLFFSLSTLLAALIFRVIYPLHFDKQPLFFSDLIGFSFGLPIWSIYIFGFFDLLLIWLIGKILFNKFWAYLSFLFFSFSPWFLYTVVLGSFYIYLLFLVLIIFLSLFLIKSGERRIGGLIFIISSSVLLYSSIVIFLSYFLFICGLIFLKFIEFSKLKLSLILISLICLPVLFMAFRNPVGLNNIVNNQIDFLSDPGLKANINLLQGESKKRGFSYLSKISENKYVYLSRYTLLKLTKNIIPSTFFTSEEKLLGFSFTPPIYLGLLIPFFYGIYLILFSKDKRKYLILSLVLIIPAFFSQKMVDLNRLILFEPILIYIITYGLSKLFYKKEMMAKLILILCVMLVSIQFVVIIFDINLREYPRFDRSYGISHWQIDKQ